MDINILQNYKSGFFGQYYGQKVMRTLIHRTPPLDSRVSALMLVDCSAAGLDSYYLELKPPSLITKEDALVVAGLIHSEESIYDLVGSILKNEHQDNRPFDLESIETAQYDQDQYGKYYHTDVKTIGKIVSCVRIYDDGDIQVYDETGNEYEYEASSLCRLKAWDYLRSKGYALPWNSITVEEMVEAGWVKLIEA